MKKVLFSGCSYVAGSGFDLEKNEPNLWVNLLHQNSRLNHLSLVNCAVAGRSNQGIFQDTVWHLTHDSFEYAFVSWSSMPRYELSVGVELYPTELSLIANSPLFDITLNDVTYTKSYLENIRDRLISIVHIHHEITNLISYINSLLNLSKLTGTKIFFINSLCPWDKGYFDIQSVTTPDEYTQFTQDLLNVKNRDDEEIFKLYNKMHNDYAVQGGICEEHWLNLYQSLRTLRTDTNNDNVHPGIQSNQQYFKILNQAIENKLSS